MNRLFFRPEHAGVSKTAAAASTLASINPDTEIETYNINITTVDGFNTFKSSLADQATGNSRVSLLLSCVDNYEARIHINRACLQLKQQWMESGVSEDAVSGTQIWSLACLRLFPSAVVSEWQLPGLPGSRHMVAMCSVVIKPVHLPLQGIYS